MIKISLDRHHFWTATLTALFLFVSAPNGVALGQEETRAKKDAHLDRIREHMSVLEPYVGTWVRSWTLPRDRPDNGLKAGEKMSNIMTYEWCQEGTGLLHTNRVVDSQGNVVGENFIGIFYWDELKKTVVGNFLANTGNPGEMEVVARENGAMDVNMVWDRRQQPFLPPLKEDEDPRGRVTVVHTIDGNLMSMVFRSGDNQQGTPIEFQKQEKNECGMQ